jgi:putative SOS response-associated peptidase YedK
MCGRYTRTASTKALKDWFPLLEITIDLPPRYNIAPTQTVPVVRRDIDSARPELALMRWGLIPSWAQEPSIGNRLINARCESAADKPFFSAAFRKRRCLVPADGFYEWQKQGKRKQPYCIRLKDGSPFAFAGLWEYWNKGDVPLETFTILTTDANDLVRPLHDRMPCILDPRDYEQWIDPNLQKPEQVLGMLRPLDGSAMTMCPVSDEVNSPKNDGPGCLAPPAEAGDSDLVEEGRLF